MAPRCDLRRGVEWAMHWEDRLVQGDHGGGDVQAIGRVDWEGLESFCPLLRGFLGQRCRDENEAEDLVQETLIKAARSQWGVKDRTRIRGWILRVASNVWRDHIRKLRRGVVTRNDDGALASAQTRDALESEGDGGTAYDLGHQWVAGDVLLHSLGEVYGHLRDRDRQLLNSYYGGDEDTAQTAEEFDIQRSAVKVRLFRARQRLGKALRRNLNERHARRLLVRR